ncbi:MAG: TRAP transporter small permease [Rhodospirillaceae bacterium]
MDDGTHLHRSGAARLYEGLHGLLGTVVAASILFITAGISIDVFARNMGHSVVPWMLEATEYSLFAATFLGAPWVLHLGAHVRIDMLVDKLPRRAGQAVEIATDLIGLAVSAVLLYYSASVTLAARSHGALVIKELIFPEWWIFAVVVLSMVLLCVEFLIRLCNAVTGGNTALPANAGKAGL